MREDYERLEAEERVASALASYLNLWLLWKNLTRAGVYEKQSGWMMHSLRLAAACAKVSRCESPSPSSRCS